MMVFLPFVDQTYVSFFAYRAPDTSHDICYCGLTAITNASKLGTRRAGVLSVNAHKRDLAMAGAALQ
jgi:hypothetical protein